MDTTIKLQHIFLDAVVNGELGSFDDHGAIVTLKELIQAFPDIKPQIISEFLPSVTMAAGQKTQLDNKFLSCIRKDVYRIDTDVIEEYCSK